MKLQIVKMLAVAALFGGLTACNNELTEPQADQVPENAVRITASIHNPPIVSMALPGRPKTASTSFGKTTTRRRLSQPIIPPNGAWQ